MSAAQDIGYGSDDDGGHDDGADPAPSATTLRAAPVARVEDETKPPKRLGRLMTFAEFARETERREEWVRRHLTALNREVGGMLLVPMGKGRLMINCDALRNHRPQLFVTDKGVLSRLEDVEMRLENLEGLK